VERFVGMQALNGYALRVGGKLVGYTYYLCEERKGLIGNLYVLSEHHTAENENRLLAAVLRTLMATPNVHRVESQLLMLRPGPRGTLPGSEFLSVKSRYFMAIPAERAARLKPGHAGSTMLFAPWGDYHEEAAAGLIAESYAGHVDGTINDQYRSVAGARRFLSNIVHYPGCGTFYQPASYLALDLTRGRMWGMSLASLLAEGVGHITQICVAPAFQGKGIGYELLRRSLDSLVAAGCRKVSLTVTAANEGAVQLYERVGFDTVRTFSALVWDGF
jgi:ribosomal protein S18 acetylase RimI-like enzyme